MEAVEVPTPKHVVIPDKAWRRDPLSNVARASALRVPLISKPARGSNGVGITHIRVPRDFKKGIDIARNFDGRVIVEKYHQPAQLLECNIIEDEKKKPVLSEIIKTNWNEKDKVFNFISRSNKTSHSFEKAKDLDPEVVKLIHDYAKRTFEVLKLSGYAQIEFMIDKEGELLVVEVNCQPYFGKDGSFALSWKEAGISYPDLIDRIVKEALDRPAGTAEARRGHNNDRWCRSAGCGQAPQTAHRGPLREQSLRNAGARSRNVCRTLRATRSGASGQPGPADSSHRGSSRSG